MTDGSPFSLRSKGRLVDQVVDKIQGLIIDGQLEPGTKLPPEIELAEQMGVSRTVLREAMSILMTKGLLETKPGVGTIVLQMSRDQVVEPLSLLVQMMGGGVAFEELHQVRSILEVEIAGLAARQATKADVAGLEELMTEMEMNQSNADVFAIRDADFHQALAHSTHNPLLDHLVGIIRDLLEGHIMQVVRHIDPQIHVLPYHRHILDRIVARDEAGARQAMLNHLNQVKKNYEEAQASRFGGEMKVRPNPNEVR
jgi:GntR family transcriptional repressor for pyruvate dehydrogenase complex